MSAEQAFDAASVLEDLAAGRPSFLDLVPIGDEQVAWAISALERVGLHPSLSHIHRALGRGTQRMLRPIVNEYYRQHNVRPDAPVYAAPDDALRELFAMVAKHVRHEVLIELSNERERIHDAQIIADRTGAEASAKLILIEERVAATQALSDGLRHELSEGRSERSALQGRLDRAATELAQSRQALEDANVWLSEVSGEKTNLASHVDELIRECAELRAAVSNADENCRLAEERAAAAKVEAFRQREIASENERLVKVEQGKSKMLGKRVEELIRLTTRQGNQLSEAKSRLTRQRTINSELETRSRSTFTELAETKKKLALLQRRFEKSEEQSVQAASEVKSLREQLGKSARESRQLRATCLRLEKEHKRLTQEGP